MGEPQRTFFGHINQIHLMEIFLFFVSHCVPNLSVVNSFFFKYTNLVFAILREFAPKIPSLQKSFSCKRKFSTNLSILTR